MRVEQDRERASAHMQRIWDRRGDAVVALSVRIVDRGEQALGPGGSPGIFAEDHTTDFKGADHRLLGLNHGTIPPLG
jgi:hypothetical protein